VKVDLKLAGTLLGGYGYFVGTSDAIYLDPERWVEKAGGLEEAIAEEERRPIPRTEDEAE
jgi:hypothetical protein